MVNQIGKPIDTNMKSRHFFIILILMLLLTSCKETVSVNEVLVTTNDELKKAIKEAKPGDDIVLQDGVWKDVQIKFKANGEEGKPITLRAQTPGKVFIEGESNVRIGGSYLNVKDLYFRNGYTPSKCVIRFKADKETPAFHCSVTNCVIEEFTQPSRDKKDHWIELWGQHNTVANNYITGKSNQGPTLRAYLSGNEHINNYHQVVNNHFGPRPRKGGPKSETMQLGDSYTSMTPAYINVENNFFERCNGEVEIISSKSNFNQFKNNVFFECEGSLVLRHGNYANIEGNVFIGNDNSEFIGGIRVINTGHWITNNYFYNLKGNEFRAPLAVMNGIPKSPLNRYNQVTDAVIAYNSFVNTKTPFHFSVGANLSQAEVLPPSEIRSARPIRVEVANNFLYNENGDEYPIKNYDKVDGVKFANNILNNANKSEVQSEGLITKDVAVEKVGDYIYLPKDNVSDAYVGFGFDRIGEDLFGNSRASASNKVGAIINVNGKKLIDTSKYGTSWFTPDSKGKAGATVTVSNSKELVEAIQKAKSGDKVVLKAGDYSVSESVVINKELYLASEDATKPVTINFTSSVTAFEMQPKGYLHLDNLVVKGNKGQHTFKTLDENMSKAYNLFINNTEISDFKSVLEVSKGAFADTISVVNSKIKNCERGFQLNKETNDKGDYNSEFVIIKNSEFDNVAENILDYYRGGYDESTIGGSLFFENNTVTNSGKSEKSKLLIKNRGIVNVVFEKNTFKSNPVKAIAILWGAKNQKPVDNSVINSGEIKVVENLKQTLVY